MTKEGFSDEVCDRKKGQRRVSAVSSSDLQSSAQKEREVNH